MKQNYYYGTPSGDEELVLDILSKSDVKSFKTSSIPLTEFWLSRNVNVNKKLLDKIDSGIDFNSALKCFEYPVYATKNEKKIGRPSMTDLMILTEKFSIAIEGKFTEDLYETIDKWLPKSIKSEKPDVLQSWYNYIEPYCNYKSGNMEKIEKTVVYQFLHRTASACYCASQSNTIPVVLYQLFYDIEDPKSKQHQEDVAKQIKGFASLLQFNPDKIKLLIELTPITNFREVKQYYDGVKEDLFTVMKRKVIYKFE